MQENIIPKGALEGPSDERDYIYEEVFGSVKKLPSSVFINDEDIQNQDKAGYPYGCVFFANSHGINALNFVEGSAERSTGKELADFAEKEGLFDPKKGAFVSSGPKVGMKKGYLSGYAVVSTLEEVKDSIANKRPVQFGSNKIDWAETRRNNYVIVAGSSYGHSMLIDGYNDGEELLRVKQSYGAENYDKGYIWLRYEDFDAIMYPTKFSLIDKEDELLLYKKRIMENITIESARIAFTNGIWNGLNPQQPATREETAAMIQRAMDKISKAE